MNENPSKELPESKLSPLREILVGSWQEDVWNNRLIEAVKKVREEQNIEIKEAHEIVKAEVLRLAGVK